MKKERKPLFQNVNSFFSFDNKNQIDILPIKNEVLTKMSYGLNVDETIHTELYIYFCKFLEEYVDEELLSDIWGEEDYEIVYDSEKLKLKIDMNSIWDKVLDVCMGNDYGYTRNFSKRNIEYSYEEFIKKVNKIRTSISIIKEADEKKTKINESFLDEELNEKLYRNFTYFKMNSNEKRFQEFCKILIKKCDLALKIPEEVFKISSLTIDMDNVEEYIDLDKLYLYISFGFLDEIKQIPNIEDIEAWKLEFLVKVYNYIKKNYNTDLKVIAAPQSEKANGKIKMGNIDVIINDFEGLLKNKQIKERIRNIFIKEKKQNQEKEQIKKEPQEKVKIDKIPLNMIAGIEDIYSIQLIINGNNTIKKQIKEFDDFSLSGDILEYIKNDYLYSLIVKIKFLNSMDFSNLMLNLYLSESGSLEIKIDFISFLENILEQYGLALDFNNYTSVEEIKEVFKDTLLNYGERLSTAEDNDDEINKKYLFYKNNVDDIPYSLYITRIVDSILELVDYVDLIKEICETNISYNEINKRIDKDKYYLSVAINLFTKLYNQYMQKERINKEEYLFLAKYIEILRKITKRGYKVYNDSFSCEDLLEKYEEFISQNELYDLDNASLYNAIATEEARKTLFSNWKIIPNGTIDVIRFSQSNNRKAKRKSSFARRYSKILSRKYFLDHTDYDCMIEGVDGLKGYVGYKYKNGIIILEKFFEGDDENRPVLGNATYVMTQSSFLRHSFKNKTELQEYINAGYSDVLKKNHSSKWEQNIMDIINNWGYDPSIVKSMDELIEESKKQKNGAVLSWKK